MTGRPFRRTFSQSVSVTTSCPRPGPTSVAGAAGDWSTRFWHRRQTAERGTSKQHGRQIWRFAARSQGLSGGRVSPPARWVRSMCVRHGWLFAQDLSGHPKGHAQRPGTVGSAGSGAGNEVGADVAGRPPGNRQPGRGGRSAAGKDSWLMSCVRPEGVPCPSNSMDCSGGGCGSDGSMSVGRGREEASAGGAGSGGPGFSSTSPQVRSEPRPLGPGFCSTSPHVRRDPRPEAPPGPGGPRGSQSGIQFGRVCEAALSGRATGRVTRSTSTSTLEAQGDSERSAVEATRENQGWSVQSEGLMG